MTVGSIAAIGVTFALFAGCSSGTGSTTDGGTIDVTTSCGSGSLCGSACANLQTDNANCGACGTACTAGEVCSQGKCGTSCGGGTKLCGSTCADVKNDPKNCGDCGTACNGGEVCSNSVCATTCANGQTVCGGDGGAPYCASTQSDNANCGACGVVCGAGLACSNGTCNTTCESSDGGASETLCTPDAGASYCANTTYDPGNCGACGTVCTQTGVCSKSACVTRGVVSGNYAAFITASQAIGQANVLYPNDVVSEANNWGGFYFQLGKTVTSVDITFTGAGGSAVSTYGGGSGGTATVNLTPTFLANQTQVGFWVIAGQAGKVSAGGSGGTAAYRAFNGGGAATDWSSGQNTYTYAGGGGGGTDLRFTYNGATSDPHDSVGDPTLAFASRFAIVGGGGGATLNGNAFGGYGGGLNLAGGDGAYTAQYHGYGATLSSGGAINGALGLGGDGLQDGSEGWAGGGGGGDYGGGAPTAHGGGGGGSGYLLNATGLTQTSTASGTQAGNTTTTRNGAFSITVH